MFTNDGEDKRTHSVFPSTPILTDLNPLKGRGSRRFQGRFKEEVSKETSHLETIHLVRPVQRFSIEKERDDPCVSLETRLLTISRTLILGIFTPLGEFCPRGFSKRKISIRCKIEVVS